MGLLGAALVVGAGLWATGEEQKFERAAAREIQSRLQDVKGSVSVNIRPTPIAAAWGEVDSATITADNFSLDGLPLFTEPDRSQKGKLGTLRIRLKDFTLRKLKVAELQADIPGCRYDFALAMRDRQLRLSRSGVGDGWVKIREEDLAAYLVRKFPEIKRCTVRVMHGIVWVEGYGEFLIIKTNFAVIAKISVTNGTELNLSEAKVFFDWRETSGPAVDGLLQTLNPVIDLDKDLGLYDAVQVEEIRLRDGVMFAKGKTKIPVKPLESVSFREVLEAQSRK
mgnify:FL=1